MMPIKMLASHLAKLDKIICLGLEKESLGLDLIFVHVHFGLK